MGQLIKVTRGGQVTIPAALRRQTGIEIGDYLEVQIMGDSLILSPKQVIDKSQAYFWTEAWQAGEREAEEDLRAGRMKEFETLEDLIADLDVDVPEPEK
jgi:AbrB family looped-hinge helix DNA binding protein